MRFSIWQLRQQRIVTASGYLKRGLLQACQLQAIALHTLFAGDLQPGGQANNSLGRLTCVFIV